MKAKKTAKSSKTKAPAKKKTALAVPGTRDNAYYWNVRKYPDVVAAKEAYDIHSGRGFAAFAVDAKGNKSAKMPEFDPSVGGMLFIK